MSEIRVTPNLGLLAHNPYLSPDSNEYLASEVEQFDGIVGGYRTAAQRIMDSDDSPARKNRDMGELRERIREALEQRTAVPIARVQGLVDDAEARSLDPYHRQRPEDGYDKERTVQWESEIRSHFRDNQDSAERAYLQACEDNDRLTIRALESGPKSLRLISDEIVRLGSELWAEKYAPSSYSTLQDHRILLGDLKSEAARALHAVGGPSAPDPETLVGGG